jgi:lipopolysaccharide export system permease protein
LPNAENPRPEIQSAERGLNILQRYIFREWAWTFLAVSFVLMIVLLGLFLGDMFDDIADGRMPAGLVGTQMVLYLPRALGFVLPLAGFVAIMWGLGRLYRDQEMAVMRASGFRWQHLLRPLLVLTLPVAVLLLVIELLLAPLATDTSQRELDNAIRNAAVWGLQAGQFHVMKRGQLVIYVEAIGPDGRSLNNVFVNMNNDDSEQVWIAREGEYWLDPDTKERYLTLRDGEVTERLGERLDVRRLRFERNDLRLPEPELRQKEDKLESRKSGDLLAIGDASSWAELQWRFAPASALMVLALVAIPLAHSNPREGRGGRVVLGILVYALYSNVLVLWRSWVATEALPVWLGLWWAHLLVLLLSLVWLQRQGRMPRRG